MDRYKKRERLAQSPASWTEHSLRSLSYYLSEPTISNQDEAIYPPHCNTSYRGPSSSRSGQRQCKCHEQGPFRPAISNNLRDLVNISAHDTQYDDLAPALTVGVAVGTYEDLTYNSAWDYGTQLTVAIGGVKSQSSPNR